MQVWEGKLPTGCPDPRRVPVSNQHSLGDEGEGVGADRWTGHQADGQVAQGAGVVHTHDCVEHVGDGVGVSLFGAGVAHARVQDGASMQHQQQHVDLGGRCGQRLADFILRGRGRGGGECQLRRDCALPWPSFYDSAVKPGVRCCHFSPGLLAGLGGWGGAFFP